MPRKKTFIYWAALVLSTFMFAQPAYGAAEIPAGFKLIASAPGVELYRKNYQNGTPDFVQVINLSLGAQVIPMHGAITEPREEKGVYGGPDPRMRSQPLNKYWQELKEISKDAFCVGNGQFFYMKESPTRLPFPLRVDGQVVSDGYGLRDYPDQKLLLMLWPGRADIVPLNKETLYGTSAPSAVAGLTEDARKSPSKYVGRTFIGVDDQDGDGSAEIVLIFSTRSARQKDAAAVLRDFGADNVMMFDGGGSAQLTCQGKAYVASERLLPQAFGVVAAPESALQARHINEEQIFIEPVQADGEEQSVSDSVIREDEPAPQREHEPVVQASFSSENPPLEPFKFEDVIWVPAVMAPVMAIVLLLLVRQRLNI